MAYGRTSSSLQAPGGARLFLALVVATLTALALGVWGFAEADGRGAGFLDDAYGSLRLLTLNLDGEPENVQLEIARFLAPMAGAATLVQGLLLLVRDAVDAARARVARDHVVVAGAGRYGSRLARAFAARGERVSVVELDPVNPAIGPLREANVAVIVDDATTPGALRRARVERARYLVVSCGEDGVGVRVAFAACALPRTGAKLTTLVELEDLQLWPRLRARAFSIGSAGHRVEFFNVNDTAARILVDRHPPFGRLDERGPHVVIVGLDGIADALLLHLARRWRLARSGAGTLPVSVVAGDAERRIARLAAAHPALPALLDVDVEPSRRAAPPADVAAALARDATAAYVCVEREADAAAIAIGLAERLPPRAPPVVAVVSDERDSLLGVLQAGPGAVPGLRAFGVLDNALPPELLVRGTNEVLARAKHEQYVRAEQARGLASGENPAVVPWSELPDSLKESNRAFADRIGPKLAAAGWAIAPDPLIETPSPEARFEEDEVESLARMEHDGWCDDLRRQGWMRDGPVKDPERRLHPLLVPWDELPEEERAKDREAVIAIPHMLAEAGFRLFRAS